MTTHFLFWFFINLLPTLRNNCQVLRRNRHFFFSAENGPLHIINKQKQGYGKF